MPAQPHRPGAGTERLNVIIVGSVSNDLRPFADQGRTIRNFTVTRSLRLITGCMKRDPHKPIRYGRSFRLTYRARDQSTRTRHLECCTKPPATMVVMDEGAGDSK